MKKQYISGIVITMCGLLIALGPQFIFKACPVIISAENCGDDDSCRCSSDMYNFPICHWSARAEIGMGMLIAALGICLIMFIESKTRLGLSIGIFLASIIALLIPNVLIGQCGMVTMACRRIAFPFITGISIAALLFSVIIAIYNEKRPVQTGMH